MNDTFDMTSARGVILYQINFGTDGTLRGEGVTLRALGTGLGWKSPDLALEQRDFLVIGENWLLEQIGFAIDPSKLVVVDMGT